MGHGIVIVQGTDFRGGDGYFYYSGAFAALLGEITATFEVKRHTPGEASVFGKDSLTASLSGLAGEKNFLLEAPGKVFSITGNWLEE